MDAGESTIHTTLSRSWLMKTGAFLVLLLGFGIWGTVDALWLYPERGLSEASYKLRTWMASADGAGKLTASTFTINDPAGDLRTLNAKEDELRRESRGETGAARAAAADVAKLEYLQSLSRAWRLNSDVKPLGKITKPSVQRLVFDPKTGQGSILGANGERADLSVRALGEALDGYWKANQPPNPLSGFDMAFQYVFMGVGLLGGAWILFTMFAAARRARQIRWDAGARRLHLPAGVSMSAADLTDIDKREWHKFYCTMMTKDGGRHRVDLLRYEPLEDWVLDLEREAFPDREKAEEGGDAAAGKAENQAAASPNT